MKGASKSSLDYLGPRIVSSLQNIASQDTSAAAVLVQQITQKPTKAIKLGSLQLIKNYFFEQKLHYSPACNLFKRYYFQKLHFCTCRGAGPQSASHLARHPHRFLHHRCSRWFPGNQEHLRPLDYSSTRVFTISAFTVLIC